MVMALFVLLSPMVAISVGCWAYRYQRQVLTLTQGGADRGLAADSPACRPFVEHRRAS